MIRLDENRPYGTVYEMPGVRYQQDGRHFRANGTAVDEPEVALETEADGASGLGPDDLRRPENKALKAQLDVYGETWTTAKAAREFINKGHA